jgi:hypothetical protein
LADSFDGFLNVTLLVGFGLAWVDGDDETTAGGMFVIAVAALAPTADKSGFRQIPQELREFLGHVKYQIDTDKRVKRRFPPQPADSGLRG